MLSSRTKCKHSQLFFVLEHRPDRSSSRDLRQTDGHSATLLYIVLVSSWFRLQQVRSRPDGNLLLETAGAVPPAHQHEGIFGIWLQLCDQLPLHVARDLDALLVVQDLKTAQNL